jgi:hypothetical protein
LFQIFVQVFIQGFIQSHGAAKSAGLVEQSIDSGAMREIENIYGRYKPLFLQMGKRAGGWCSFSHLPGHIFQSDSEGKLVE